MTKNSFVAEVTFKETKFDFSIAAGNIFGAEGCGEELGAVNLNITF